MDRLDWQCWILEQQGFLSAEQIRSTRSELVSHSGKDLFDFLVERQLLTAQARQQAELMIQSYQQSQGTTAGRTKEEDCARLLSEVLKDNPWFEPRGEWLWERISKIGEGGMGAVYRVRDRRLGRLAALKVLLAGDDAERWARFIREVKVTARLDHPSIPPVYDAGQSLQGERYMVMKLIDGETLRDRILRHWKTDKGGEPRELLEALVRVSEALAYAHSQGIIHRDLKPENIMIGQFGEVLVMDWGIAKDLRQSSDEFSDASLRASVSAEDAAELGVTVVGTIIGTPGYMAPEQIEGQASAQSDVYALGLLLVEILTGQCCVAGNSSLEKVAATATGHLRYPRDLCRGAPRELDSLARAALQLDTKSRLKSAEQFTKNLQAYLAGKRVAAHRYSLFESTKRFIAERPGFFVSLFILFLFGSMATISFILLNRSETEKLEAQSDATEARVNEARLNQAFQKLNKIELLLTRGTNRSDFMVELESVFELGGRDNYGLLLLAAKLCVKGDYLDKAKELLDSAVFLHPKAYEALFLLHELELRETPEVMFRKTDALFRLDHRRKQYSDVNEYTLMIDAVVAFKAKKPKEALKIMEALEQHSRTFAFGYCFRGNMKCKLGDLEGGMADFKYALSIKKDYGHAYFNCGVVAQKREQIDEAIRYYDQAIQYSPKHAKAYCNRGVLRERKKDLDGAFADYETSLSFDPNLIEALCNRGRILAQRGDVKGAKADLNRALRLNPTRRSTYVDRGNIALRVKELKSAEADFSKAIELGPRVARPYKRRAFCLKLQKRYKEAVADYSRAIELDPDDGPSHFYRGSLNWQLKNMKTVLADYQAAEEKGHRTTNLYYNRARFQQFNGDPKAAARDYERCLKMKPDSERGPTLRAYILKTLGRKSRY